MKVNELILTTNMLHIQYMASWLVVTIFIQVSRITAGNMHIGERLGLMLLETASEDRDKHLAEL